RRLSGAPTMPARNSRHAQARHDTMATMLQAASLRALARVRHAFFTREGGVSDGVYASLNGGAGAAHAPPHPAGNAPPHGAGRRMAAALGAARAPLPPPSKAHPPDGVTIERPWRPHERPRADAIVTAVPGLAIGVTTADCGPVLFADETAGVIAVAHAGWRGA